MNRRLLPLHVMAAIGLCFAITSSGWADTPKDAKPEQAQIGEAAMAARIAAATAAAAAAQDKKHASYAEVIAGAEDIQGMIPLHHKDMRLLGEITPGDLNRDLMVAIAIARGIGEGPLLGGMTWNFGDNWIWQFRKVDDRIQIVRKNVRFRAAKGSPQAKAVQLSYTDSILYSLPIISVSPGGNCVVDLTPVFMSDVPQISAVLRGFAFAPDRSSWASIKGFKDNIELQVAATYASGGNVPLENVPDTRGVTLYIHYSISRLPETGYQPRLADDRVGHFLSVIKDYSKTGQDDQFVRYINRWDLRKVEPNAKVSPPVTPVIFWIEKTVPYKFRGAVREGILEWNKAFEKAGFANAIEVRQQPDDATWDPEDINYNTFRWITSDAGFAMGPSRVNPFTGQILDADIIFDASFIESWNRQLDFNKPPLGAGSQHALNRVPTLDSLLGESASALAPLGHDDCAACQYARGMGEQLTLGRMAMAAHGKSLSKEQIDKFLADGVKSVVIHEVGHTLGLRHNFKASNLWTMEELNDPAKTRDVGLAASVMDYMPVNISPKGRKQGDFFSLVVGPYDNWAIEYAYKPIAGGPDAEAAELRKIASRDTEPALQYATDDDVHGPAPDPRANLHDMSKDPIEFAQWRIELLNQILPDVVDRMVEPGEGYQRARLAMSMVLREHLRLMGYVAHYVGGIYVHRDHKGDPDARPPLVVTEAKKQRDAMAMLDQQVFGPEAYKFPPKLYDYLAPTHWTHWGMKGSNHPDFPIHDVVLAMQDQILGQVLSPVTLSRLVDSEVQVPANQDAFTAAELLERLTSAIFRETEKVKDGKYTNRTPAISSVRRNLQQHYFQRLAEVALGNAGVPADCETIAAAELKTLESRIKTVLDSKAELDGYTRAHLTELASRIQKVLDARLERRP
ncbi:MAG: zinc-dependent metalloprotease [Planctomycetaceae bacterium]|nr:zinc-dependent metalloprotease [Planctomycetaceae bacterium]